MQHYLFCTILIFGLINFSCSHASDSLKKESLKTTNEHTLVKIIPPSHQSHHNNEENPASNYLGLPLYEAPISQIMALAHLKEDDFNQPIDQQSKEPSLPIQYGKRPLNKPQSHHDSNPPSHYQFTPKETKKFFDESPCLLE